MPWIQNISLEDCSRGFHFEPGANSMLIQICDPDTAFPKPKAAFREVHQFHFLDAEWDTPLVDESWRCTPAQAASIVALLRKALDSRMNVVVHCHVGVCRSGAVVDVGVAMGFSDPEVFRDPNRLVKGMMLAALEEFDNNCQV